jgi:hypothetical protein
VTTRFPEDEDDMTTQWPEADSGEVGNFPRIAPPLTVERVGQASRAASGWVVLLCGCVGLLAVLAKLIAALLRWQGAR